MSHAAWRSGLWRGHSRIKTSIPAFLWCVEEVSALNMALIGVDHVDLEAGSLEDSSKRAYMVRLEFPLRSLQSLLDLLPTELR